MTTVTTSFLDVIAADESDARLASRKAVLAAKQRVDDAFGKFLAQHGMDGFEYVAEDIEAISHQAAEDYGVEDGKSIFETLRDSFESILKQEGIEITTSVHESRKPKMCPFHSDVVGISLAQGEAKAGFEAMAQHWGGPKHCQGEGYEGSKCNFKPQMTTQSWWDERAEKAEQRKRERAEQAEQQGVEEQQLEEVDDIDAELVAEEAPATETIETEPEGAEVIPFPVTEPSAVGEGISDEIPMSMAASTKEADDSATLFHCSACGAQGTYDSSKGNPYRQVFAGNQCKHCGATNTIASGPSEKASKVAADDELGGKGEPEPKIDKRKWTPQTVPFLDDVDDPQGPHPTVHKDIVEPIKPANADGLTEIGEQVTERVDVTKDYSGTDSGPTRVFPNVGQADPVTSAKIPDDVDKNPITALVQGEYDGFLPAHVVQQAVAAARQ